MAPPCSRDSNIETKVSSRLILSEHMKLHKPAKKQGHIDNEQVCLQLSDVFAV